MRGLLHAFLDLLRKSALERLRLKRLRAAGVAYEDRAALLGHACRSMPELYASPDISCLIGLANRVLERMRTLTVLRIVNGRKHGVPSDDGCTPVLHTVTTPTLSRKARLARKYNYLYVHTFLPRRVVVSSPADRVVRNDIPGIDNYNCTRSKI